MDGKLKESPFIKEEKANNTEKINGFKQTEIGWIPEDWEVVRLGEVAEVIRGVSWRKEEATKEWKGIPVLTIPNVEKGKINFDFSYFLNKEQSPQKIIKPKDIVFVASSGSIENIGRNAMIKHLPFEDKIAFASFLAVIRAKQDAIAPEYLYFLINSHWIDFSTFAKRAADGKYNFQLREFERNILLPLPPLPEQQRIAKVLDKIQQAIEIQDRIIEETKNLKKSLMQKLFTEGLYGEEQKETEIGLIPKSWEVVRLGEVVQEILGGDWGVDSVNENEEEEYLKCRVIRGTDFPKLEKFVFDGIPIRFLKKRVIQKNQIRDGDLLIEISGGSKDQPTGRVFYVSNELLKEADLPLHFTNFVKSLRIKSQNAHPKFVFGYWTFLYHRGRTKKYEKQTTNIRNFKYQDFLYDEFIPLPPLEEQKQIARILSTVDRKIEIEQRKKELLKELFKTMLHKLMSGEIRLKEVDL